MKYYKLRRLIGNYDKMELTTDVSDINPVPAEELIVTGLAPRGWLVGFRYVPSPSNELQVLSSNKQE